MAQPLDYVEYLSKEIGARPAGTEEEQEAALYIADQFQEQAGYPAAIEEFTSSSNLEGGLAILSMITIVVSVLAMLFNVLTAPAFVLAVIAAVIYVLESYDHPIVSSRLARGASQNVVAKYQPSQSSSQAKQGTRQRKIVLVAHYDTGKVTPGIVRRIEAMKLPLPMVCLGGMVAAAFFLLLRFFLGGTGGAGLVFINLLTIIAIIIVALPIVKAILYRVAPYNEGANDNATGVAALIEIARRINDGSLSEADLQEGEYDVVVHGEQAAWDEGLVPDGAELRYEADATVDVDAMSDEERLLSAKAAIAALTGRSVDQRIYAPIRTEQAPAQEPSQQLDAWAPEAEDEPEAVAEAVEEAPAVEQRPSTAWSQPEEEQDLTGGFENAPSWFIAAQRNAKRPESEQPVQRSRYTEAIQAAERELAAREQAREDEERARRAQELRDREEATRAALASMREAAPVSAPYAEQADAGFEDAASIAGADEHFDASAADARSAYDERDADAALRVSADDLPEMKLSLPELELAVEGDSANPIPEPGRFEDRLDVAVDLGQTIAYTPQMIREAIQEELAAEQAAPLTQEELPQIEVAAPERDDVQARQRLVELPQVDGQPDAGGSADVPEQDNPSRSGLFRMLRTDVPSLSGVIQAIDEEDAAAQSREDLLKSAQLPKISLDGDASAAADEKAEELAQSAGDELAEAAEVAGDRESLEGDAEPTLPSFDLEGEGEQPEADDFDMGGYEPASKVEMPKSRAGNLLNRLRRKSGPALTDTPQEWLDVDEDFEAREVGRERGGWESFRDDADGEGKRTWEGGAFSRVRLGHVDTRSGAVEEAEEADEVVELPEDQALNEEIEQIYHFRNPDFNAEIWFVALGSDTELHDGARAFVEEHKSELRGAMVVELEALGVGELCVASEEGGLKKMQASSRIKRFTRGATEATGIVLGQVKLATDSITSTIQKAGLQAMHLVGIEDGLPALKGSADDILENVDEMLFEENIDYVMELLRQD